MDTCQAPPFPRKYKEVMLALAPYYQSGQPLEFFFEMYVFNVIGELPKNTVKALAKFCRKNPSVFAAYGGDWMSFVVGSCRLSNTIEVAIWDLWIKNSASARENGTAIHPWYFALHFMVNYLADGSEIDVWREGELERAIKRIEEYRRLKI